PLAGLPRLAARSRADPDARPVPRRAPGIPLAHDRLAGDLAADRRPSREARLGIGDPQVHLGQAAHRAARPEPPEAPFAERSAREQVTTAALGEGRAASPSETPRARRPDGPGDQRHPEPIPRPPD